MVQNSNQGEVMDLGEEVNVFKEACVCPLIGGRGIHSMFLSGPKVPFSSHGGCKQ